MEDKIVTLCTKCKALYEDSYRVRPAINATTELKKQCENCKMRGSSLTLARYLISKKGK